MPPNPRTRIVRQLRGASGRLSTAATTRMESDLPWFAELGAEERSWIGLIVQAGIRDFIDWYKQEGASLSFSQTREASLFAPAPRALAGIITLHQTVDLLRLSFDVVEQNLDSIIDPEDLTDVRDAVLRYGREAAFAAAEVYARAAEVRGAWDARLEALVVDAVLRDETDDDVLSRASAVGWGARGNVAVVLGAVPDGQSEAGVVDAVRHAAQAAGMDALGAVQGHRLVVILGGVSDPEKAAGVIVAHFGEGPVVVGPVAADLGHAYLSAQAASAGLRAAVGWPEAPRPVLSEDLLPERILAGDEWARMEAVERVFEPLAQARGTLVDTLSAYFAHGAAIEPTARALFVHPNTVRYRLGQVADLTGLTPSRPRDALTLQLALALGRL
ncbi:PucR family transcriptional regulator [Nocardioides antri]|uniref:PucR family transcriptional regulator n=1 Tax=Nocardioides antri TaxID=2607659 RepID=A0A5B1M1L0_9ACTN|nr:helix-turn-helix domain-containing protein [Nocardioides antri]KAA1426651.1 PucR family transcriptional regulator [Nocardioides antri]